MVQGPPKGPPYYGPPRQSAQQGYGPPARYGYGAPQSEDAGPNVLYWVLGLLGVGFVLLVGLVFAIGVLKGIMDAKSASSSAPAPRLGPAGARGPHGGPGAGPGAHGGAGGLGIPSPDDSDESDDDEDTAGEDDGASPGIASRLGPRLPPIPPRDVPHHEVKLLQGCSDAELRAVVRQIDEAVALGAPRYNRGDFQGCYDLYVAASTGIERDLSKACRGPIAALETGRDRAAKAAATSDKAWAMRDAFDGLVDVIERKGPSL